MTQINLSFRSTAPRFALALAGIQGPPGGGGGGGGGSGTNLAYDAPTRVISSSTGTGTTLPLADNTNAGLMSSASVMALETALQPGASIPLADVTGLTSALAGKQDALGYIAESTAQKGQPGGYAALDGSGRVPSAQLPSFVDDVIESASFAALPVTGETGKIYVTLADNRQYRWSGSAYVEISASPGSTDAVPEGSVNLYHTPLRVRGTDLTGYAAAGSRLALAAGDTILSAFGKVGKWLADLNAIAFSGDGADLQANSVANSRLSQMAAGQLKGRVTAGAGDPEDLTAAQATALLDTFTTPLKGLVPPPGTSSGRFLRDDGLWAAAGGGGFGVITAVPAANQADWNPSGFNSSVGMIVAQSTTNCFLSGIAAGAANQVVILVNDSSFLMCLERESAGSAEANRFRERAMGTIWVLPGMSVTLRYDDTLDRWALIDQSRDVYDVGPKTHLFLPNSGTAVNNIGLYSLTTAATVSHGNSTTSPGNDFDEANFFQVSQATSPGNASVRAGSVNYRRGAVAGRQGFFHTGRVRFPAMGATGAVRAGMGSTAAAITTLNAVITQCLFLGADGGQTNLRIFYGGAAPGTPIDLGADFPAPSAGAAYEYAFLALPGVSAVEYMVRRLDSRFVAQGTLTANIPTNTTPLGHRIEVVVGATAAANTVQANHLLTLGL